MSFESEKPNLLLENEKFSLFLEDAGKILISVHQPGYDIKDFDEDVLKKYPRVQITNFLNLKGALQVRTVEPVNIGVLKPKIEVILSNDKMKAKIKINVSETEFESMKNDLEKEVIRTLEDHNVTYGILYNVLKEELKPHQEIVVAEGVLPTNGEDAIIKYIHISEKKPLIREDGKADHYELNLIQQASINDWVGEKIPATAGEPGKTVTNQLLPPMPGKDQLLRYDHNSIAESTEGGKIVLRALVEGAVTFQEGKIKILNHLIIEGNVDYDTGNINFNGYVTIKGIVCDGFSVKADKDISILGEMGSGAVKEIISKEGDIYIKGGISGKGRTIIKADKNVFVKYVKDCTIVAGENINIGLYAIDVDLHGKSIMVNSEKGKIIGGSLNAEAKISVYTIGNISERRTFVNVKGFDRQTLKKELDNLLLNYKECLIELEKNKRQMKVYEAKLKTNHKSVPGQEYQVYIKINDELLVAISKLENRRKVLMDFLNSKGEGEVNIFKQAYPQTFLEIKNIKKRIDKVTRGTYFATDNQLHFS